MQPQHIGSRRQKRPLNHCNRPANRPSADRSSTRPRCESGAPALSCQEGRSLPGPRVFPHLEEFEGMMTSLSACCRRVLPALLLVFLAVAGSAPLYGSESSLKLPDLNQATFMGSYSGPTLLMIGLAISALGFVFGIAMYMHLRNLPVHESMREISELIYETCKTYLLT